MILLDPIQLFPNVQNNITFCQTCWYLSNASPVFSSSGKADPRRLIATVGEGGIAEPTSWEHSCAKFNQEYPSIKHSSVYFMWTQDYKLLTLVAVASSPTRRSPDAIGGKIDATFVIPQAWPELSVVLIWAETLSWKNIIHPNKVLQSMYK